MDEKPLSYHVGFIYNKWFYYYKPTFDFSFRNYSPGKIHIWYLIKDSINSDLDRFDFGIGYESYKEIGQMKPMKQLLILFQKIKTLNIIGTLNGKNF